VQTNTRTDGKTDEQTKPGRNVAYKDGRINKRVCEDHCSS